METKIKKGCGQRDHEKIHLGLSMGGGTGCLLNQKQGGIYHDYLYDGKGNVTALIDGTQNVAATYRYGFFGNLMAKTGTIDQQFLFSTKRYDENTGLSYFGYRFYNASVRKWMTRDPLGESGGINLYAYVQNDPVNYIDPDGLSRRSHGTHDRAFVLDPIYQGGGGGFGGSSRFRGRVKGPSGRVSIQKYIKKRWDKGTFANKKQSIKYHVKKHGKGLTDLEYTQRAMKALNNKCAKITRTFDKQGRPALKVVAQEGAGLFTPQGKIIWFHPK